MNAAHSPWRFLTPARLWLSPRARFVGPYLLAALLGWAGTVRLRRALDATAQLTRQQANGSQTVYTLEQRLHAIQSVPFPNASNAIPDSLLEDPSGIASWLCDAEREARHRGWTLQHEIGEVGVRSQTGHELLSIPVRLHLTPAGRIPEGSAHSRFLQWSDWMLRQPRRPEVLALVLAAGANGLSECRMDLELRCILPRP